MSSDNTVKDFKPDKYMHQSSQYLGDGWRSAVCPRILAMVQCFTDHTIRDDFLKTAGFYRFKRF